MKKATQILENEVVMDCYSEFMEFCKNNHAWYSKDFRSCKAEVFVNSRYTYLKSYNTIVAFIDHKCGVACDVLRLVYGYTATSAQHISKFFNDYAPSDYYEKLRYKAV